MFSYHRRTEHTWESVRRGASLDWSRQPAVFKIYPDSFPRLALDGLPELEEFLQLSAGISARKVYPGGEYFFRVNPSAGALYPCELYVQARNIHGLDDGIFHFEPESRALRLLYPLDRDQGLEACLADNRRVDGLILLISAVYHRSSWKYGSRALRYCLLDSGHLAGAIEAAAICSKRPFFLHHRLDRQKLNRCFGFADRELVMAVVVSGRREEGRAERLDMELDFVDPAGWHVPDPVLEAGYAAAAVPAFTGPPPKASTIPPLPAHGLGRAIRRRRSIRAFQGMAMEQEQYAAILEAAETDPATDCDQSIRIWSVINRVRDMEPGLYRGNKCLRRGDFSALAGYLCLEQALGADSGVTFFLTAARGDYLPLMIKAGLTGQRIYLGAELAGLGCSGIGAYYDREVMEFLQTDDIILYALAVGR